MTLALALIIGVLEDSPSFELELVAALCQLLCEFTLPKTYFSSVPRDEQRCVYRTLVPVLMLVSVLVSLRA